MQRRLHAARFHSEVPVLRQLPHPRPFTVFHALLGLPILWIQAQPRSAPGRRSEGYTGLKSKREKPDPIGVTPCKAKPLVAGKSPVSRVVRSRPPKNVSILEIKIGVLGNLVPFLYQEDAARRPHCLATAGQDAGPLRGQASRGAPRRASTHPRPTRAVRRNYPRLPL